MPPKRKSTGARAAPIRQSSNSQATLSFHGKQNKVTKAGTTPSAKTNKKDPALYEDIARAEVKVEAEPEAEEPTTADAAIQQQADEEAETLHGDDSTATVEGVLGGRAQESEVGATGGKGAGWVADEEAQARKISDIQIKRYWKDKEAERLAPRVHQEDLTVFEKVLREWDMSGQYGVSAAPALRCADE